MGNDKRIILNVDGQIYENYKTIYDTNGWISSKQFEIFMIGKIKREGKKNGK